MLMRIHQGTGTLGMSVEAFVAPIVLTSKPRRTISNTAKFDLNSAADTNKDLSRHRHR